MVAFLRERWGYLCAAALLVLLLPLYFFFIPATGFPKGVIITIPADASSNAIGQELETLRVLRSAQEFELLARVTGQDRALQSGIYRFDHPLGLAYVLGRLVNGEHGIDEVRITLTEGMTVRDMAATIAARVPGFDAKAFLAAASTSEGYLFPDTYFILPNTPPQEIVQRLRSTFDQKIATLGPQIQAFGRPLRDDVIVASLLEREVRDPADKRIVAGILYNRLKAGMALQVDSAFGYAHGIDGYVPTAADIAGNSPYNTYRFTGLPPTPISNPGLDSLRAAVMPTHTDYFYYLTGTDGKTYFAKTFEEHKRNRARYLN